MQRNLAILILYSPDKKVGLQDRRSMSKFGEEWGFFGGGIEEGETPLQAAVREAQEELDITLEESDLNFILEDVEKNIFNGVEWILNRTFYAIDFEKFEDKIIVKEGDGLQFFTFEEADLLKMFDPNNLGDQALNEIESIILNI